MGVVASEIQPEGVRGVLGTDVHISAAIWHSNVIPIGKWVKS